MSSNALRAERLEEVDFAPETQILESHPHLIQIVGGFAMPTPVLDQYNICKAGGFLTPNPDQLSIPSLAYCYATEFPAPPLKQAE